MDEAKLKADLNELSSLGREMLTIIFKEQKMTDHYKEYLDQYKKLKAEILLELAKDFKIPKISDPALRNELKAFLKHGDEFVAQMKKDKCENVRNLAKVIEKQFRPELDDERMDELASNLFYSWFSGYDYVYRLINTGTIVVKNIEFPKKLESLINELRHCLIFENYLAAGIMLRTIVEIAADDVLSEKYPNENFENLKSKLKFLEGRSSFAKPASILNAYRKQMNEFVHGERLVNKQFVKGHVDVVLECVEKFYEEL